MRFRNLVRAGLPLDCEAALKRIVCWVLAGATLVVPAAESQGAVQRRGTYLFALDLQGTPLDEFPSAVRALNGTMTVVDKDGQHMLRASSPSEFLITLPQVLPADFTVELDFIPKGCCAPDDIMLEGTPSRNRGVASAELTWHPERISAVGGGGEMYQSAMPADLAASMPGSLTHLVVVFQGTTIKLYTNGRRLYTLEKQFARGRVLRVWLGGADEDQNAVFLAQLRIRGGPATLPIIAGNTPGADSAAGGGGATGSNPRDPGAETGSAGGSGAGAATGGSTALPPRTITLSGFTATGGIGSLAPRTITLSGLTATGGIGSLAPRTLTLDGFTATGSGSLAPRTITLPGLTASGVIP